MCLEFQTESLSFHCFLKKPQETLVQISHPSVPTIYSSISSLQFRRCCNWATLVPLFFHQWLIGLSIFPIAISSSASFQCPCPYGSPKGTTNAREDSQHGISEISFTQTWRSADNILKFNETNIFFHHWLVVWNSFYDFLILFHILEIIIPPDQYFSEGYLT